MIMVSSVEKEEENFSTEDLKLYLASILYTGLSPQSAVEDYFVNDPTHKRGSEWMKKHFTEKHWYAMRKNIHISKIYKNIVMQLRTNFQKYWNPYQYVVIDEIIIPSDSRFSFKQFVRGKPHDTGNLLFNFIID